MYGKMNGMGKKRLWNNAVAFCLGNICFIPIVTAEIACSGDFSKAPVIFFGGFK